jgi:hypothetical protein
MDSMAHLKSCDGATYSGCSCAAFYGSISGIVLGILWGILLFTLNYYFN